MFAYEVCNLKRRKKNKKKNHTKKPRAIPDHAGWLQQQIKQRNFAKLANPPERDFLPRHKSRSEEGTPAWRPLQNLHPCRRPMPGTSSDPPGCARLAWCLAPLCGYEGKEEEWREGGAGGRGEIRKNIKCKDRQCLVVFCCHFFVVVGGGGGVRYVKI